jgi:hypothetical protein
MKLSRRTPSALSNSAAVKVMSLPTNPALRNPRLRRIMSMPGEVYAAAVDVSISAHMSSSSAARSFGYVLVIVVSSVLCGCIRM